VKVVFISQVYRAVILDAFCIFGYILVAYLPHVRRFWQALIVNFWKHQVLE
jgi:hypothetical protein